VTVFLCEDRPRNRQQPITPLAVIPAKAGIQLHRPTKGWTLTFVRVTVFLWKDRPRNRQQAITPLAVIPAKAGIQL